MNAELLQVPEIAGSLLNALVWYAGCRIPCDECDHEDQEYRFGDAYILEGIGSDGVGVICSLPNDDQLLGRAPRREVAVAVTEHWFGAATGTLAADPCSVGTNQAVRGDGASRRDNQSGRDSGPHLAVREAGTYP